MPAMSHVFVEHIPDQLEKDVVYVSTEYQTSIHLCACDIKTVMPIGDGGWNMRIENNGITFSPSIGNYSMPCKSHYWITNGKVVWA